MEKTAAEHRAAIAALAAKVDDIKTKLTAATAARAAELATIRARDVEVAQLLGTLQLGLDVPVADVSGLGTPGEIDRAAAGRALFDALTKAEAARTMILGGFRIRAEHDWYPPAEIAHLTQHLADYEARLASARAAFEAAQAEARAWLAA